MIVESADRVVRMAAAGTFGVEIERIIVFAEESSGTEPLNLTSHGIVKLERLAAAPTC
jgi:hypothetical protein